jgi:hypothetical protein
MKEEEGKRKNLRKCVGAPVDYGALGVLSQASLRDTYFPQLPCKAKVISVQEPQPTAVTTKALLRTLLKIKVMIDITWTHLQCNKTDG